MELWLVSFISAGLLRIAEIGKKRAKSLCAGVTGGTILLLAAVGALLTFWLAGSVQSFFVQTLWDWRIMRLSHLDLNAALIFVLSLLILDLAQYVFHLVGHKAAPLWFVHAVHHSDENVGPFTGLLHHPAEAAFNYIFILSISVLLGLPIIALLAYGALASLHNAFAHSRLRLPARLDSVLNFLIVTPAMHHVHHSTSVREGGSNFGQVLSIWDRIFKTYLPAAEMDETSCGLQPDWRPTDLTFLTLLLYPIQQPWRTKGDRS